MTHSELLASIACPCGFERPDCQGVVQFHYTCLDDGLDVYIVDCPECNTRMSVEVVDEVPTRLRNSYPIPA
jgi:hypothetical protein